MRDHADSSARQWLAKESAQSRRSCRPGPATYPIGVIAQQISKLLARLAGVGLIENRGDGQPKGVANACWLTRGGSEVERAIGLESAPG